MHIVHLFGKRIDEYNGVICDDLKEVIFKSDDDNEKFYEKFGYEPDEQSWDIQNKSINTYDNLNICDWLEDLFPNEKIVDKKDCFNIKIKY